MDELWNDIKRRWGLRRERRVLNFINIMIILKLFSRIVALENGTLCGRMSMYLAVMVQPSNSTRESWFKRGKWCRIKKDGLLWVSLIYKISPKCKDVDFNWDTNTYILLFIRNTFYIYRKIFTLQNKNIVNRNVEWEHENNNILISTINLIVHWDNLYC